jgi:hypothetical protein
VPASLATNLKRNVRLYERHGFRVVDEVPLPGRTIPTWIMRRHPARARAIVPWDTARSTSLAAASTTPERPLRD